MTKKIAIVCNYALNPNRIGGMDRFFVAFDEKLKANNWHVDWFFTNVDFFDFYKKLNCKSANSSDVTEFFLKKSKEQQSHYDVLITHFVALCISFAKFCLAIL